MQATKLKRKFKSKSGGKIKEIQQQQATTRGRWKMLFNGLFIVCCLFVLPFVWHEGGIKDHTAQSSYSESQS